MSTPTSHIPRHYVVSQPGSPAPCFHLEIHWARRLVTVVTYGLGQVRDVVDTHPQEREAVRYQS